MPENGTIWDNQQCLPELLLVQLLQVFDNAIEVLRSRGPQHQFVYIIQGNRVMLGLRIYLSPDHVEHCRIQKRLIASQYLRMREARFQLEL